MPYEIDFNIFGEFAFILLFSFEFNCCCANYFFLGNKCKTFYNVTLICKFGDLDIKNSEYMDITGTSKRKYTFQKYTHTMCI